MNPELFIQDAIRKAMIVDTKNDPVRWFRVLGMHGYADTLENLFSVEMNYRSELVKQLVGLKG